jgi:HSP20 family molecular chaperone IbpA
MFVSPAADIYEDEQGLVVIADVPGVDPSGLDVGVERGILTIRGRAAHLVTSNLVHREYELTGFFRQFQLPDEVDASRIEAELKNGVLFLRLPRTERAQPRRIEVRSG